MYKSVMDVETEIASVMEMCAEFQVVIKACGVHTTCGVELFCHK